VSAGLRPDRSGRVLLLFSVFVVAACGLAYELVAGTLSSYLLGDATTQFSLTIGVFLCAMGAGSWLARFVKSNLLVRFIELEVAVGVLGGASSIALFAVSAWAEPIFPAFFYLLLTVLGALVGVEVPLIVRIVKDEGSFTEVLSDVLALDYLGALAGSILFPLFILPVLGLSRAAVVFGLLNLGVAALALPLVDAKARRRLGVLVGVGVASLAALLLVSPRLVGFLEDALYEDHLIYAKSTRYQRIVVTRWHDDLRLYLDGHLQFSSIDEARYHEALVVPAMEAVVHPRSVLVLGGGDGLAVREILKYPTVEKILLVDLDPDMTELGRSRRDFVRLNEGSLASPKVSIVNADAMQHLREDDAFYDVILVDLPDPDSEVLAKLYSTAFYALAEKRLALHGVLVTQATSPFYSREAFWSIVRTLQAAVPAELPGALHVVAYHESVPSFGEWGFALASHDTLDTKALAPHEPTRYLTPETLQAMFVFGKDMTAPAIVRINRLDDPVLFRYHRDGWRQFNE
jgi:spermidine synthase